MNLYTLNSDRNNYEENTVVSFELSCQPNEVLIGKMSYLSLSFTTNVVENTVSFASGSAMNIFRRVQIIDSNGTVLEDLNKINLYTNFSDRTTKPAYYTQFNGGMGQVKGYGDTTYTRSYNIPLPDFSKLFTTSLHSSMVNKMRILLEVDDTYKILNSTSDTTKIQVVNPRLNLTFKKDELEVPKTLTFQSYKEHHKTYKKQTENNFPYRLSKCKNVISFIDPKLSNLTQKFAYDYSSPGFFIDEKRHYRYKLKSSFYPHDSETKTLESSYQQAVNNLQIPSNSLPYSDFLTDMGCMSMNLGNGPIHPSKNQLKLSIRNKSLIHTEWELTMFVQFEKQIRWDEKNKKYKVFN